MELKELQTKIDTWIREYGVRYFDVLTNTALLTEEVGELSGLLARIHGEQSFKKPNAESPTLQIADEMADVLFVLVCLANQLDIDLTQSMIKNLEKKTVRDQNRHKKNTKLL